MQSLEVADIFRDHGAAWRRANAGHVSLDQLKVMSAIERCRTAALGGHVARCEDCAHTVIAYNSCRNRHCPKCQGAAANEWLAEREAELLPVPYYHVVFTLPAPIADIAYQNKAVIYDLLFKAAAETVLTIAADPKHLGARVGITAVLHTWGSALTHHPHIHMIVPGGGISLDGHRWVSCRPNFFLPVRVLSRLFRRLFLQMLDAAHGAGQLQFFGEHMALIDPRQFAALLAPLRKAEWVVYSKRPFGGPKAVLAYLARYTHRVAISNRRLISADDDRRHLQVEGLPDRRAGPLQDDDAGDRRVHPTLPDPRAAEGLPSHPTLRTARQRQPSRKHCACTQAARRAVQPKRTRDAQASDRRTSRAAASMSVLRRPNDHHRDLRARLRAEAPSHAGSGSDQDRHLMMPSPSIHDRSDARHSCWLSAGSAQARIGSLDSPARATNPVALRADRSFTPTHAPMFGRKPIAAIASVQAPHARPRGEIPIAPAAPPLPPPTAISCLGAFRTPATRARGWFVIPASENLHRSGLMHRSKQHRYSITSSARSSVIVGTVRAESSCGRHINHKRESGRRLHGKVSRLLTAKYAINIHRRSTERVGEIDAVGDQAAATSLGSGTHRSPARGTGPPL